MVLMFAGMHLIGLGLVTGLLVMFLRSDTVEPWTPSDDEEDGGGGPRLPSEPSAGPSPGGIPLPDADASRVRLREPGRLGDRRERPERRPAHDPAREPTPARSPSPAER
jgi:hypothetical protein